METSLKPAEVMIPPQPDKPSSTLDTNSCEGEVAAAASSSSSSFDPMKEFSRRLEDIISTYGSAAGLLDKQNGVEPEMEKIKEEAKGDITAATETELSLIKQSLNKFSSPEEKLENLVRTYAELAAMRHCDDQRLRAQQQKLLVLQAERRSSVAARRDLETLCRELQSHYSELREEALQRCREDEEKRNEITSHFQEMLTEIQTQIEQHSTRNDKLCRENTSLTDKLESLMSQCERREESLEKINKHRDLQHKLTEAKLQQANALLAEAEDKHKREKEYLLREAIDKTKKCFAMKEQELAMKKKLTLYGQKFDEFQETLAKSNEIYVRFKKEMDNMTEKMRKMEKESNVWKTRFENCNKALTDMIEERTEKGKEYDLFVLKIQKLERLCRALQDERKVLYDKIKDVRSSNANLSSKYLSSYNLEDAVDPEGADKGAPPNTDDIQELQEEDPVLTEDMTRLREEQAKLQEFAASLLAPHFDNEEEVQEEIDLDEDIVSSAFIHFKTKTQVKEDLNSVPEPVEDVKPEAAVVVKVEEIQNSAAPTPEAPTPEETTSKTNPTEANQKIQTKVEVEEVQQVKPCEEIQQQQPEEPKADPPKEPEATKVEETSEVKPVDPVQEEKVEQPPEEPKADLPKEAEPMKSEETGEVKPAEEGNVQQQPVKPVQASKEAPKPSKPAPPSEDTPKPAASSNADPSKKQAPKKKKKRSGKSAS